MTGGAMTNVMLSKVHTRLPSATLTGRPNATRVNRRGALDQAGDRSVSMELQDNGRLAAGLQPLAVEGIGRQERSTPTSDDSSSR